MAIRILLMNVHSLKNCGDAALTQVALEQLRASFPGCQISILLNDPQHFPGDEPKFLSLIGWVKQGLRWQLLKLGWMLFSSTIFILSWRVSRAPLNLTGSRILSDSLRAITQADLVVGTPGGYLQSSGRGLTLLLILYTMFLALLAGKPIYLLPQSFGPLKRRWEIWLTRHLLNHARLVMAREPVSFSKLREWGVRPDHCRLLTDLAFAYVGDEGNQAQAWLRSQGVDPHSDRPLIGVTVMNWGAQNRAFKGQQEYEQIVAHTLEDFLVRNGGKALLFPQSWGPSSIEDDRIPARSLLERMPRVSQRVILVDAPLPPGLLKSVFGQMDLLLGTRMHSNIFALAQYVPVLLIGYNHKTIGIAQTLGLEEWVVDINQLDEGTLKHKLALLWEKRDAISHLLRGKIPNLIEIAQQAGGLIAADFAKIHR